MINSGRTLRLTGYRELDSEEKYGAFFSNYERLRIDLDRDGSGRITFCSDIEALRAVQVLAAKTGAGISFDADSTVHVAVGAMLGMEGAADGAGGGDGSAGAPADEGPAAGAEIIGSRIRVLFGGSGAAAERWYTGSVMDYDETSIKHFVRYDDGDESWHALADIHHTIVPGAETAAQDSPALDSPYRSGNDGNSASGGNSDGHNDSNGGSFRGNRSNDDRSSRSPGVGSGGDGYDSSRGQRDNRSPQRGAVTDREAELMAEVDHLRRTAAANNHGRGGTGGSSGGSIDRGRSPESRGDGGSVLSGSVEGDLVMEEVDDWETGTLEGQGSERQLVDRLRADLCRTQQDLRNKTRELRTAGGAGGGGSGNSGAGGSSSWGTTGIRAKIRGLQRKVQQQRRELEETQAMLVVEFDAFTSLMHATVSKVRQLIESQTTLSARRLPPPRTKQVDSARRRILMLMQKQRDMASGGGDGGAGVSRPPPPPLSPAVRGGGNHTTGAPSFSMLPPPQSRRPPGARPPMALLGAPPAAQAEGDRNRPTVKVVGRIRPACEGEEKNDGAVAVGDKSGRIELLSDGGHSYDLDCAVGPSTNNAGFLEASGVLEDAAERFREGGGSCIICCGGSQAGKTYTLEGGKGDRGLIYRAVNQLLAIACGGVEAKDQVGSEGDGGGSSKSLGVSLFEVYRGEVHDMLPREDTNSLSDDDDSEDDDFGDGRTVLLGGTTINVVEARSKGDVQSALKRGYERRLAGWEESPERKSKAHLVVTLHSRKQRSASAGSGMVRNINADE